MDFLRFLESLRNPALDAFFNVITHVGAEAAFIAVSIVFFWCISKREGYYILLTGLFCTTATQLLKLVFRIPRPWVIDPEFTIVEAARANAGGYSFPSGHTQNVVGTLGAAAMVRKEKWLRIVCVVFIILVPFSRMYLGVHTPLDVGAAFLLTAAAVLALYPCFRSDDAFRRSIPYLIPLGILTGLVYVLYVALWKFPPDMDAENMTEGIKNGYTVLGCVAGLAAVRLVDRKLDFKVEAPLIGQLCKLAMGFPLALAVKSGLKALFLSVGFTHPVQNTVRYFCLIAFAGILWPMTFPFFAKLGKKSVRNAA